MPNIAVGGDNEGWRVFVGKWAERLEVAPRAAQLDIFANHIFDGEPVSDFFPSVVHYYYYITIVSSCCLC